MKTVLAAVLLSLLPGTSRAESPRVPDQTGLAARLGGGSLRNRDWQPVVNLPPGATAAVLSEDPVTHGIEALVRFPAGYAVPKHWHKNSETFLLVKGRLRVRAGGKDIRLAPGDTLALPPNLVHSLSTGRWRGCVFFVKTDQPVSFIYVNPEDRVR